MGESSQSDSDEDVETSVPEVATNGDVPSGVSGVGRYSQFQRTMLQWSSLHPYNAVHVIRIA